MTKVLSALLILLVVGVGIGLYIQRQFSTRVPLETRWAVEVNPAAPLPEYPRPQLRRDRWQSLNGRWDVAFTERDGPRPASFDAAIVVPFPVESSLGGVQRDVLPSERVWYRRTFEEPELAPGQRLLLHFGAVDWEAEVWLNGARVGRHEGGYDPFSFDVTEALVVGEPQELVVAVWDPTDAGPQPVGKQALDPQGIRYTAVTGIWQTVWLEPVPRTRVEHVSVRTDLDASTVSVRTRTVEALPGDELVVEVLEAGKPVGHARVPLADDDIAVPIALPRIRAWSPDSPFLYDVRLELQRGGDVVDRVDSYFGAREVSIGRDGADYWRLFLNGEPIFHIGLLDQGWWPDGLYTAPTDEALAFDIRATKQMGFNVIRKHVKVEPARWYWHADRLGILVWQDMPSGDGSVDLLQLVWNEIRGVPHEDAEYELHRTSNSAAVYRRELDAMLDTLEPFASIVVWVPFNEAWGQFDTDEVLEYVQRRDPARIVDGPSGWKDTGSGHLRDFHMYRREAELPRLEADRPIVYGEFGGLGRVVEGHLAVRRGWGYQSFGDDEALRAAYAERLGIIETLIDRGLAGAIYTQTTDVESEVNGLLTYDRAVFKIPPATLAAVNRRVIERLEGKPDEPRQER